MSNHSLHLKSNKVVTIFTETVISARIPLVMEGKKQLRNRRREKIVALASEREEI